MGWFAILNSHSSIDLRDEVGDVEQELLIDDGAVAPLKTIFTLRWNFGVEVKWRLGDYDRSSCQMEI